jgi:hypothetical protein
MRGYLLCFCATQGQFISGLMDTGCKSPYRNCCDFGSVFGGCSAAYRIGFSLVQLVQRESFLCAPVKSSPSLSPNGNGPSVYVWRVLQTIEILWRRTVWCHYFCGDWTTARRLKLTLAHISVYEVWEMSKSHERHRSYSQSRYLPRWNGFPRLRQVLYCMRLTAWREVPGCE